MAAAPRKFGVISSIGAKYGFIDCPPVHASSGCQVFCPSVALQNFNVGDTVEFDLLYNPKGQPQASNVGPKSANREKNKTGGTDYDWQLPGGKGGRSFFGTIHSIGNKFGFIDCPPVQDKYGTQVFCPQRLLDGFSVGESVNFDLKFSEDGQPQAATLSRKGSGKGKWGGKGKETSTEGGRYFGTVCSIGSKFGFINCPPLEAQYNAQVFVPTALLHGISVGDKVDFQLMFNDKWQPQATHVSYKGYDNKGGFDKGKGKSTEKGNGKGKYDAGKGSGLESMLGSLYSVGSKFGFIECPAVRSQYGCQVFCSRALLDGITVGDEVYFDLVFNDNWQPQAANVSPGSPKHSKGGKGWNKGFGY
eukprot:TRINITY_DN66536_c0_g1_i1.p1 TRINITY_DN66536_c0_g1~~TRINITY_DN66536_c0_g1_i1.p1  ORF type:complete len:361 (-),score=54.92 TRINITY_DN66536_c0_g1_i1:182-1264(-)